MRKVKVLEPVNGVTDKVRECPVHMARVDAKRLRRPEGDESWSARGLHVILIQREPWPAKRRNLNDGIERSVSVFVGCPRRRRFCKSERESNWSVTNSESFESPILRD